MVIDYRLALVVIDYRLCCDALASFVGQGTLLVWNLVMNLWLVLVLPRHCLLLALSRQEDLLSLPAAKLGDVF